MVYFNADVHGEIAEVEERGKSQEAVRVFRFSFFDQFNNRPMLKEHLRLHKVLFQIKRIEHDRDNGDLMVIRLTPATVLPEDLDDFMSQARLNKWKIEKVH